MNRCVAFLLSLLALSPAGCGVLVPPLHDDSGPTENLAAPRSGVESDTKSKKGPPSGKNGKEQTLQWEFMQPEETSTRIVDLLFVVDTSPSMMPERSRIADTIPAFIQQLTRSTDFRIAVMLAHGGASKYSGALYSTTDAPAVLRSETLSTPQMQSYLKSRLQYPAYDQDEANGEALLYSLMRSLNPDRLSEIRAQGFYRSNAALSVVFVTDENDLCFQPQANGYHRFPDFVPSLGGLEATAYLKYCNQPGQTASNFPDLVYSKLRALKENMALTFGSITHVEPSRVPRGSRIEDSIGHGIIELVKKSPTGVLIDITEPSYATGLAELGNVVSTTLNLQTHFNLEGAKGIAPDSVRVTVDGRLVPSTFDPVHQRVEIALADAGRSHSIVVITASL